MIWLSYFAEVLSLGIRSLLRNKLRSFLTMLGMIFGVGSVIAMLSVGAGARNEILTRIRELGVRNIIVNSVKPPAEIKPDSDETWKDEYGIKFEDADYILETVSTIETMLRVNSVREHVWYGSKRVEAAVLGVQPEHLAMFHLDAGRGRIFNQLDNAVNAKVCVVRQGLVAQLETVEDPVGMWLRIGDYPFQIVGVLRDEAFRSHARKALAIDNVAQEIYIPYATSMQTLGTVSYFQRGGSSEYTEIDLDQLIITVKEPEQVFETSQMLDAILSRMHDRRDFEIVVPLELLRQSEETQRVFSIVMVLIASISLLVGGIGIANIMLATITERTKEIGIRRALGARRVDIVVQFLTETTAIAAVGGLIGCLFGIGGILGIVEFTQWKASIAPHYVGISLAISCTVGILFGLYPARKASQMDPIVALRYE